MKRCLVDRGLHLRGRVSVDGEGLAVLDEVEALGAAADLVLPAAAGTDGNSLIEGLLCSPHMSSRMPLKEHRSWSILAGLFTGATSSIVACWARASTNPCSRWRVLSEPF